MHSDDSRGSTTRILLFLVVALHVLFVRWHPLWNNEFITLGVLDQTYGDLIAERLSRNHMPVYFIFLKAWTSLFGTSEMALRLPSSLLTLAGILVVWRLGAYLLGQRGGLWVLAFVGVNQALVQLGYDARMYGALFLAAAVALSASIRYLDDGRKRHLAMLVAVGTLALGVQLLYLLVPLTLCLYVFAVRRVRDGRGWRLVLAAACPAVWLAPLIICWGRVQDKVGRSEWHAPDISEGLKQTFCIFLGDYHAHDWTWVEALGWLGVTACVGVLGWTAWKRRADSDVTESSPFRHHALLWLWCIIPLACIVLAATRSHSQMVGSWRYYVTAGAAAPLLLVLAWHALRERGHVRAASVYAAGLMLVVCVNTGAFLASSGTGLRRIAHHVAENIEPGDVVVASNRQARTRAFIYYGNLPERPAELSKELQGAEETAAWLAETCAGHERMWAVFYKKPKKDRLARFLKKRPEIFAPLGDALSVGTTTVQLFDLTATPQIDPGL